MSASRPPGRADAIETLHHVAERGACAQPEVSVFFFSFSSKLVRGARCGRPPRRSPRRRPMPGDLVRGPEHVLVEQVAERPAHSGWSPMVIIGDDLLAVQIQSQRTLDGHLRLDRGAGTDRPGDWCGGQRSGSDGSGATIRLSLGGGAVNHRACSGAGSHRVTGLQRGPWPPAIRPGRRFRSGMSGCRRPSPAGNRCAISPDGSPGSSRTRTNSRRSRFFAIGKSRSSR